jgi:uncharacterized membrane protein
MRGSISSQSSIGNRSDSGKRIDAYRSTDQHSSSAIVPVLALGVPLLAVFGIVLSVAPVFVAVIATIATIATLSVTVPRGVARVAEALRERVSSTRQPDRTSEESTRTADIRQTAD